MNSDAAAIAAFRSKLAAANPISELASVPTPLHVLLSIYSKAEIECYKNYMEGAKTLYKYLSPIDYQWDKYPQALAPGFRVPGALASSPIQELSKIIVPKSTPASSVPLTVQAQTIKLVILTLIDITIYKDSEL